MFYWQYSSRTEGVISIRGDWIYHYKALLIDITQTLVGEIQ